MFKRIQVFLMFAAVVAIAYPAFLLGIFLGNEAAGLPHAMAERPYAFLIGVGVQLLILGTLHWLVLGQNASGPEEKTS